MKKMMIIGAFLSLLGTNSYAENTKIELVVIKHDIFDAIPRAGTNFVATELGNGVRSYNQTLDDKALNTMMTNINKQAKLPLGVCVFENHVLVLTKISTKCESVNDIEDFTILDVNKEQMEII